MAKTAEYLIEAADQLKEAARALRDVTRNLERISNHLLEEAVKLDTDRDKAEGPPGDTDDSSRS